MASFPVAQLCIALRDGTAGRGAAAIDDVLRAGDRGGEVGAQE